MMTEQEMRMKAARRCTSQRQGVIRIDQPAWELVRKNGANKTGWTRSEVDLWAAREVEAGTLIINKTSAGASHGLMNPCIGKGILQGQGDSPQAEREMIMVRVRKWVGKNAKGRLVAAAQVKTMKDNIRGRAADRQAARGPAMEIDAALLLLAVREGVRVECTDTRRPEWVKETMQWASERQWIEEGEVDKMSKKVQKQVVQVPRDEAVCLELGSGWRGASQGLIDSKQWSRVLEVDMVQQNLGRGLGIARPDITARFVMKGQERQGGLFRYFRKRGNV